MVPLQHFQQTLLPNNPASSLDVSDDSALFCAEERFEEADLVDSPEEGNRVRNRCFLDGTIIFSTNKNKAFTLLDENDMFWEDGELECLLTKEKNQTHLGFVDVNLLNSDGFLRMVRKEAVGWMLKVISHYCFNALTSVLAVNYYDRFISSHCFQRDKPWMSQLAAVACLSIAAKVEETQVPLLLDLQVEESKYVFEAKTIQRMELLVLSALNWKMNPVTPISFFDHIVRRFGLMSTLHWEFMSKCEDVLVSIISDYRLVHYIPSVVASATMFFVIKEIDPCNAMKYQTQLMDVLKITKEKVDHCYELIVELMDDHGHKHYRSNKRKHPSVPASPSGVIDAYFGCDSSNDSWAAASSVSSSPEPLFKKSRAQDQQTRLAPLSSVSVGAGSWHR